MGDDEVIVIEDEEEDCDELEEDALKKLDELIEKIEEYDNHKHMNSIAHHKAYACWTIFYNDSWDMSWTEFGERGRKCADLENESEEIDEKLEELAFDVQESRDVWKKAEKKWTDCIHKETRVGMRLP